MALVVVGHVCAAATIAMRDAFSVGRSRSLRVRPADSTLERNGRASLDSSLDSAARRRDQASDDATKATRNRCGNANFQDGKPCGRRIDEKTDDQPNKPPEHAYRRRADKRPPYRQREVPQSDRDRLHNSNS